MNLKSYRITVGFSSEDRLDYTIINGVNLASRIETNAEPNKILLSEDTYLLIKNNISCLKKQKISVKGIYLGYKHIY